MTTSPGLSWNEDLIAIGLKGAAVDRSVENHGGGHSGQAEGANKGGRFPVAMGNAHAQSLPARSPPVSARHIGRGPGLVDKDEAFRIEIELPLEPILAPFHDVRAILLARMRRLFLRVIL